jgi:hypothetical protein
VLVSQDQGVRLVNSCLPTETPPKEPSVFPLSRLTMTLP